MLTEKWLSYTEIETAALWNKKKTIKKKKIPEPIQSKKKKKKEAGVQEICMAPSPPDQQRSRSADVTGRGSLFSLPLGGGIQVYHRARDGTVSSSAPLLPSIGLHRATPPAWWISCSILLSWMIWGIIPKVSSFSLCYFFLSFRGLLKDFHFLLCTRCVASSNW